MAVTAASTSVSPMPAGITNPAYKPSPGRLGNLTAEQMTALETFRKQIIDDGKWVEERMGDAALLRWLRARKFDVVKAKEMLYAAEKWRVEFGVDEIVKTFEFTELEEVDKYYPQYYHKTDKEGRPIYIERLGKLDIPALYACTSQTRLLQRLVYEYEKFITDRLPASSLSHGFPVETSCTILDLSNVSLSNFIRVKDYISAASTIGQSYYPERMGKFYIINAPWTFSVVWSAIKPWLDEVTVEKILILGSGKESREKLLEMVDPSCLSVDFGGKCTEGRLDDLGPWNEKCDDYVKIGRLEQGKEHMPTMWGAEGPEGNKEALEKWWAERKPAKAATDEATAVKPVASVPVKEKANGTGTEKAAKVNAAVAAAA